jgi:hypothetical protein
MLCTLVALMLEQADCIPPPARPKYEETFRMYGPVPDCLNRDRHIRYLTALKAREVQDGDDAVEYDQAIDIYVARLKHYCQ